MGGFENNPLQGVQTTSTSSGDFLSNVRAQALTDGGGGTTQNNGGQWRAAYGSDVNTTFTPGQPTQQPQPDGQWRAGYGSDVGTTYRPGQPQTQNPPGYDATMAAAGPQPQARTDGSALSPAAASEGLPGYVSDGLPEAQAPVSQRSVFTTALAGGTGAYLLAGPVPGFLNTSAEHIIKTNPQLGTKFFGADSWLAKNNATLATRVQSGLDTAPSTAAQWWQKTYVKPAEAAVATPKPVVPPEAVPPTGVPGATAATGETIAAARTFKVAGMTLDMTKAGEVLAKPGVQTFLKGAAIAGGTVLVDHITPGDDSYGFSAVGVPVALAMPGDFKTKAIVAGGSLLAGKVFNAIVPASEHPGLHNFLAPNLTDTALMTGALFLPVKGETQLAVIGGSYAMGRMAKLDNVPAGGVAIGVGLGTYMYTHNAPLACIAGLGSFVGSRVLQYI